MGVVVIVDNPFSTSLGHERKLGNVTKFFCEYVCVSDCFMLTSHNIEELFFFLFCFSVEMVILVILQIEWLTAVWSQQKT